MPIRSAGGSSTLPGSNSGSIRQVAQAAGFTGTALDTAVAIAMAESGGNAQAVNVNTNGSRDRGLWQINNQAWPNVSDACAFDPLCAAKAAYRISQDGTDFSPWVTYQTGAYLQYFHAGADYRYSSNAAINSALSPNAGTVSGTAGGTSQSSGGGGFTLSLGSLFSIAAGDMAQFVFDAFIKFPAMLIGDYLIVPFYHWNQRAIMYYQRAILFSSQGNGVPQLATIFFWTGGYVLLWSAEGRKMTQRVPPEESRLAKRVRRAQLLPARRRLTKPTEVRSATARKPKPVVSSVPVVSYGRLRTSRVERVKVTDSVRRFTRSSAQAVHSPGSGGEKSASREHSPREPDAHNRARTSTLRSGEGTAQGAREQGGDGRWRSSVRKPGGRR